ncbi:hypothetical protein [Streptomyces goshikiensis]
MMHHHGPEDRLLRFALKQLVRVEQGAPGTHPVGFVPSYPDRSDCLAAAGVLIIPVIAFALIFDTATRAA